MVCNRKICKNQDQIAHVRDCNSRAIIEGQSYQWQAIPEPIYELVRFSFKLENVISYYEERNPPHDIVSNMYGDGFVRMESRPDLIAVLETRFSTC